MKKCSRMVGMKTIRLSFSSIRGNSLRFSSLHHLTPKPHVHFLIQTFLNSGNTVGNVNLNVEIDVATYIA
jgi:hypothetical protein